MKNFIIVVTLSSFFSVFSQKDTAALKLINDDKKVVIGSLKIEAVNSTKKTTPDNSIDINKTSKISEEAISKSIEKNKPETVKSFVLEQQPKEKDILEKKHWMGNDVSEKKLESHLSLGTINSNTKRVKIECRDHSFVDGDRIRIFLNEKVVSSNLTLEGNYFFIYINLEPGYNRIDFQALNEGLSGPNTAELVVYDESGKIISSQEWNLPTGAIATLGIIKK